jgi:DNA-directed RNA polymerase subunit RPC12/RpoP
MAMIEFEDHGEEDQMRLVEYLDREEQASSRLICPRCGAPNLIPWVKAVTAYTCWKCGQAVQVPHNSGDR